MSKVGVANATVDHGGGRLTADLDTLCTRAALPAHEGMAAVGELEVRGLVECALTGEIRYAQAGERSVALFYPQMHEYRAGFATMAMALATKAVRYPHC